MKIPLKIQQIQGTTRWVLILLLLLAAAVRVYGITFGLPHTQARPDEDTIIQIALGFLSGDLNPHYFFYPTLYMYLLYALYYTYIWMRLAMGSPLVEVSAEIALHPQNFYLISRGISALSGTLTILPVYLVAHELFDRKTALIASFFMSIAYLHVRDSHFGNTDTLMTCFMTWAILYIVRCYTRRTTANYLLAGVLIGLAASTKYGMVTLLAPLLAAHLCVSYLQSKITVAALLNAFRDYRLWLAGLVMIVVFFACSPFILLDFRTFLQHFSFQVDHIILKEHREVFPLRGWWYHLRYTLPYGLGWGMLLTAAFGTINHYRKDWKSAAIFSAFPLLYYVVAGNGFIVFVRYMIPMTPFVCIVSAAGIVTLSECLQQRLRLKYALPGLILLIAFQPLSAIVQVDRLLAVTDNRVVAAEWIERNLPPGSTIYQSGTMYGQVQVRVALETLQQQYETIMRSGGNPGEIRLKIQVMQAHPEVPSYRLWLHDVNDLTNPTIPPPDYIILQKSPLIAHSPIPKELAEFVQTHYCLVQEFEALDLAASGTWYNQIDAFFLPFAGFSGIECPGPNLYIYQSCASAPQ